MSEAWQAVLLGQQCWLAGLAYQAQDVSFLGTIPSCHSIPAVPWWAQTLSCSLGSRHTVKPQVWLWGYHGSPAWSWSPARTGGGDGEAKLCQEWAWGMQQRSHCRAGTDTCRSFQPAARSSSWMEGSPKAWETGSGRWPAPTGSSSCLAYAKYNKMH